MKLADRVVAQLRIVRDMSEQMLKAFQLPSEWTHQVAPGTNHALWFAGHMAACDNWLIKLLDPSRAKPMDEWDPIFQWALGRRTSQMIIHRWPRYSAPCASGARR